MNEPAEKQHVPWRDFQGNVMLKHPSEIQGAAEAFYWVCEMVATASLSLQIDKADVDDRRLRVLKIVEDELRSAAKNLGPDEVQLSFYVCEFCGVRSPKRWWGPGWVTCPKCRQKALTVHEKFKQDLNDA